MRPERLSNPKHPAQKPVAILEKMLTIASNENDIVFDPFMGVGSTGVASMKLSRRFIGIEIDATYCNAARDRINQLETSDNNYTSCMAREDSYIYNDTITDLEQIFQL